MEATRQAGLNTIKVRVDDDRVSTDVSLLESAFVANFHNEQMTELEQAQALATLVDWYGSQSTATTRIGMPQASISSKLSLLKLSPELQADLTDGHRLVEHVRNLGKFDPEQQREEADRRAQQAEQRRAENDTAVTSADTSYHGVIAPGGSSQAFDTSSEVSNEDAPGVSDDPGVPNESVETTPSTTDTQSTEDSKSHTNRAQRRTAPQQSPEETLPWHDMHALAAVVYEHTSPEQRVELLHLLRD